MSDCWIIDTAFAVLPNPNIDAKWLYYSLSLCDLTKLNESTGVPSISREYLYRLKICYFSLSEQRNIARILSTVDEVIEKTEASIAKYQAIKAGMMHDLFTRGIDPATGRLRPSYEEAPELYKKSELGWVPREWKVVVFDSLVKDYFDYRGRTPTKLGMHWGEGQIKAISANNIEPGRVNFEKEHYTGSENLYNAWMTKGDCMKGDVIMTSEAPLGEVAQIPNNSKYILSQRVILFKTNKEIVDNDFLFFLMSANAFQSELHKYSSGSTVTGIQQARLAKLPVAMARQIREQLQIKEALIGITRKIDCEIGILNKHRQIKHALMSDLLTGKVRVNYEEEKVEA